MRSASDPGNPLSIFCTSASDRALARRRRHDSVYSASSKSATSLSSSTPATSDSTFNDTRWPSCMFTGASGRNTPPSNTASMCWLIKAFYPTHQGDFQPLFHRFRRQTWGPEFRGVAGGLDITGHDDVFSSVTDTLTIVGTFSHSEGWTTQTVTLEGNHASATIDSSSQSQDSSSQSLQPDGYPLLRRNGRPGRTSHAPTIRPPARRPNPAPTTIRSTRSTRPDWPTTANSPPPAIRVRSPAKSRRRQRPTTASRASVMSGHSI